MTGDLKLCKDCKHFAGWWKSFITHHDDSVIPGDCLVYSFDTDLVTGKKFYFRASTMREGSCGKEAKFFEPK